MDTLVIWRKHILGKAVGNSMRQRNPSIGAYRRFEEKIGKTEDVVLTSAQQEAFLNYIKQSTDYHFWAPIFVTLLGTGMRPAECLGLTRRDIDLENKVISINHSLLYRMVDGNKRFLITTPKTKSSIRCIPMNHDVLTVLSEQIGKADTLYNTPNPTVDGYTDFIFRDYNGDLLSPHKLNCMIARIIRDYNAEELNLAKAEQRPALQLPNFSAHCLRQTFYAQLLAAKADRRFIRTIMGREENCMLDLYMHLSEGNS